MKEEVEKELQLVFDNRIKDSIISYLKEVGSEKEPYLDFDRILNVAKICISSGNLDCSVKGCKDIRKLDAKCDEYAQKILQIIRSVIDEVKIPYESIRTKCLYPNPIIIDIFY